MSSTSNTQFTESLAERFLSQKGYHVLARNYQYRTLGEIDIVAYYNTMFRFVEVKSRFSKEEDFEETEIPVYGLAAAKVRTIERMARYYLLETDQQQHDYVIEGVALVVSPEAKRAKVEHLLNLSEGLM